MPVAPPPDDEWGFWAAVRLAAVAVVEGGKVVAGFIGENVLSWPDANEDQLKELAAAWDDLAGVAISAGSTAHKIAQTTRTQWTDFAGGVFGNSLEKFAGPGTSSLTEMYGSAQHLAQQVRDYAILVEFTKRQIVWELAISLPLFAATYAGGPAGWALGAAARAILTRNSANVVGGLLSNLAGRAASFTFPKVVATTPGRFLAATSREFIDGQVTTVIPLAQMDQLSTDFGKKQMLQSGVTEPLGEPVSHLVKEATGPLGRLVSRALDRVHAPASVLRHSAVLVESFTTNMIVSPVASKIGNDILAGQYVNLLNIADYGRYISDGWLSSGAMGSVRAVSTSVAQDLSQTSSMRLIDRYGVDHSTFNPYQGQVSPAQVGTADLAGAGTGSPGSSQAGSSQTGSSQAGSSQTGSTAGATGGVTGGSAGDSSGTASSGSGHTGLETVHAGQTPGSHQDAGSARPGTAHQVTHNDAGPMDARTGPQAGSNDARQQSAGEQSTESPTQQSPERPSADPSPVDHQKVEHQTVDHETVDQQTIQHPTTGHQDVTGSHPIDAQGNETVAPVAPVSPVSTGTAPVGGVPGGNPGTSSVTATALAAGPVHSAVGPQAGTMASPGATTVVAATNQANTGKAVTSTDGIDEVSSNDAPTRRNSNSPDGASGVRDRTPLAAPGRHGVAPAEPSPEVANDAQQPTAADVLQQPHPSSATQAGAVATAAAAVAAAREPSRQHSTPVPSRPTHTRSGATPAGQAGSGPVDPPSTPGDSGTADESPEFGWFDPASPRIAPEQQPAPEVIHDSGTKNYRGNTARWLSDSDGRLRSVQAHLTRAFNGKGRTRADGNATRDVGQLGMSDDDGGHALAWRFFKETVIQNLFPQNKKLNTSAYKKLENEWAAWLNAGFELDVTVRLPPGQTRPDSVTATYEVIDPKTGRSVWTSGRTFINQAGEIFNRYSLPSIKAFNPGNGNLFEPTAAKPPGGTPDDTSVRRPAAAERVAMDGGPGRPGVRAWGGNRVEVGAQGEVVARLSEVHPQPAARTAGRMAQALGRLVAPDGSLPGWAFFRDAATRSIFPADAQVPWLAFGRLEARLIAAVNRGHEVTVMFTTNPTTKMLEATVEVFDQSTGESVTYQRAGIAELADRVRPDAARAVVRPYPPLHQRSLPDRPLGQDGAADGGPVRTSAGQRLTRWFGGNEVSRPDGELLIGQRVVAELRSVVPDEAPSVAQRSADLATRQGRPVADGRLVGWSFFGPAGLGALSVNVDPRAFSALEQHLTALIQAGHHVTLTITRIARPTSDAPTHRFAVEATNGADGSTSAYSATALSELVESMTRRTTDPIPIDPPPADPPATRAAEQPADGLSERPVRRERFLPGWLLVSIESGRALLREEVLGAARILEVVDQGNGVYEVETRAGGKYRLVKRVGVLTDRIVAEYVAVPGATPTAEVTLSDRLALSEIPPLLARILAETAKATLDPTAAQLSTGEETKIFSPTSDPRLDPELKTEDHGDLAELDQRSFGHQQAGPLRRAAARRVIAALISSMSLGKEQPNAEVLRALISPEHRELVDRFQDRGSLTDDRVSKATYVAKAVMSSGWSALVIGAAAYVESGNIFAGVALAAPMLVNSLVGSLHDRWLDAKKEVAKKPAYDADRLQREREYPGPEGLLDGRPPMSAEPVGELPRAADPRYYAARHLVPAIAATGMAGVLSLLGIPAMATALVIATSAGAKTIVDRMVDAKKFDFRLGRVDSSVRAQRVDESSFENQLIRVLQGHQQRLARLRSLLSGETVAEAQTSDQQSEIRSPGMPPFQVHAFAQGIDNVASAARRVATGKQEGTDVDPTEIARHVSQQGEGIINAIGPVGPAVVLGAVGEKVFMNREEAANDRPKTWDYRERRTNEANALLEVLREPLVQLAQVVDELEQLVGLDHPGAVPDLTSRAADRAVLPEPPAPPPGPRPGGQSAKWVYGFQVWAAALGGALGVVVLDKVFTLPPASVVLTLAGAAAGSTGTPIARYLFRRAELNRKDQLAEALGKQSADRSTVMEQGAIGKYLIEQLRQQAHQLIELYRPSVTTPAQVSPTDPDYTDRIRAAVERAHLDNLPPAQPETDNDFDVRRQRVAELARIDRLAADLDWKNSVDPRSAEAADARARLAHASGPYEQIVSPSDGSTKAFPDPARMSPSAGRRVTGGPTDQIRAGGAQAFGRLLAEPAGKPLLVKRLKALEEIARAADAVDQHAGYATTGNGTKESLDLLKQELDDSISSYEELLLEARVPGGLPRPALSPDTPPPPPSTSTPDPPPQPTPPTPPVKVTEGSRDAGGRDRTLDDEPATASEAKVAPAEDQRSAIAWALNPAPRSPVEAREEYFAGRVEIGEPGSTPLRVRRLIALNRVGEVLEVLDRYLAIAEAGGSERGVNAALNELGPKINAFKTLQYRAGVAGDTRLDAIEVRQEVKALLSRRHVDGNAARLKGFVADGPVQVHAELARKVIRGLQDRDLLRSADIRALNPVGDGMTVEVTTRSGETIVLRFTVDKVADGHPAAYRLTGGTEYAVVTVSDQIRDEDLARAIVHEVRELSRPTSEGAFTPHEQGRMGELLHLEQELEMQEYFDGPDPVRRRLYQAKMQELVEELRVAAGSRHRAELDPAVRAAVERHEAERAVSDALPPSQYSGPIRISQDQLEIHIIPRHAYGSPATGTKFRRDFDFDTLEALAREVVERSPKPVAHNEDDGTFAHEYDFGPGVVIGASGTGRVRVWIDSTGNVRTVHPVDRSK